MPKTQPIQIITAADDRIGIAMADRRKNANKVVDYVTKFRGPERWLAVQKMWLALYPQARHDQKMALKEVKNTRATMYDPKYGRTQAALGLSPDQKGSNKNTSMRMVVVMPEALMFLLKKFDPFNLATNDRKAYRENWRMVYKTFPEYCVVEKI